VSTDDLKLIIYFLRKVYPGSIEEELLFSLLGRLDKELVDRRKKKKSHV
jgi:hypothetical protein